MLVTALDPVVTRAFPISPTTTRRSIPLLLSLMAKLSADVPDLGNQIFQLIPSDKVVDHRLAIVRGEVPSALDGVKMNMRIRVPRIACDRTMNTVRPSQSQSDRIWGGASARSTYEEARRRIRSSSLPPLHLLVLQVPYLRGRSLSSALEVRGARPPSPIIPRNAMFRQQQQ